MPNKQCPYRIQEHPCKHPTVITIEGVQAEICPLCLAGQKVDAIELVASAIMEKSIDKMEDENENNN